jgi:hypothetical protein
MAARREGRFDSPVHHYAAIRSGREGGQEVGERMYDALVSLLPSYILSCDLQYITDSECLQRG